MTTSSGSGPHLAAALLCEKVLKERDDVSSFIRIVDRYTVTAQGPEVPQDMPDQHLSLKAVVILKGGDARGRDSVDLTMEAPSGRRTDLGSLPVVLEAGDRGVELIIGLELQLGEEGLYWIDVILGRSGQLLTRMPLRLIYQPISRGPG